MIERQRKYVQLPVEISARMTRRWHLMINLFRTCEEISRGIAKPIQKVECNNLHGREIQVEELR
jgi:hypothetical protein